MFHGELLPYQCKAVQRIFDFEGRALLAMDMGLGKTATALAWYDEAISHLPGIVVVIAPATACYNWQAEIQKFLGSDVFVSILSKRTPPESFTMFDGVYIISYDCLGSNPHGDTWLSFLLDQRINLIILDEAQYIQSPTAKRTKGVIYLSEGVPFRLALTGTPFMNSPYGLYPILRFLGLKKQFPTANSYYQRYCNPELKPWGWQYKGVTNARELHEKLTNCCMIRYVKKDVLHDLPPKIRKVIPLDINNRSAYELAKKNFIKWIKLNKPHKLTAALRAERLVQMTNLKQLACVGKLDNVISYLDDLRASVPQEKIIVFGIRVELLKELHHRYSDSVLINGSVSKEERTARIAQFVRNSDCNWLFGNLQAAGVAWNGQVASHIVFVEMGWNPAIHDQAESRAHRMGAKHQIVCHYLVAHNTIEERLCLINQQKQEYASAVIDGDEEKVTFSVYDELQKYLLRDKP